MNGYSAKVRDAWRELSAKEKVMFKDTSNTISIDEATQSEPLTINYGGYVIVDVHNPLSDNPDYVKYIIIDKDTGEKYATGSESFWSAFNEIYEEMADAGELDFTIKVYRKPSKNFKGKDFITCSLI